MEWNTYGGDILRAILLDFDSMMHDVRDAPEVMFLEFISRLEFVIYVSRN